MPFKETNLVLGLFAELVKKRQKHQLEIGNTENVAQLMQLTLENFVGAAALIGSVIQAFHETTGEELTENDIPVDIEKALQAWLLTVSEADMSPLIGIDMLIKHKDDDTHTSEFFESMLASIKDDPALDKLLAAVGSNRVEFDKKIAALKEREEREVSIDTGKQMGGDLNA